MHPQDPEAPCDDEHADELVVDLSDEAIRSVALMAAVRAAGISMVSPDPLFHVQALEDYIRHGLARESDNDQDL